MSTATTPNLYSGPLSECLKRFPAEQHREQTRRWHRAQMRGWAMQWRRRGSIAALVGNPVQRVAETALSLARTYRDSARALCAAP